MQWFKGLLIKTKAIITMFTAIFIVVMILNQLLFFGFCLNPVCLIAAMPHVLFITFVIGTLIFWPSDTKLKKRLKVPIPVDWKEKIKERLGLKRKVDGESTLTGRIFLIVTQAKSQGENDFVKIVSRYALKPHKIIRMNRSRYREKAILELLITYEKELLCGDILAIVRGGGDTSDPQFNPYRDEETCYKIKQLAEVKQIITVTGIGHSDDAFAIENAVDFAQITPTDAGYRVGNLIKGKNHI